MLAPRARKQLARLSRTDRERLTRAIAALPDGDVRHLVGHADEWRLRVGDWRVRYRLNFEQRVIEVLLVLPRGSAYHP